MVEVSFRMAIILIAILFFGCKTKFNRLPIQTGSVQVQEEGAVIHKLPKTLIHVRDSLVGMRLSALDYIIFNYYTGEEVKKINIDTNAFQRMIFNAGEMDGENYLFRTPSEMAKSGISPFEIYNICLDDEKPDKWWLFFAVMAYQNDSISLEGETVSAEKFNRLQFIGELDQAFEIKKYYYIHTGPQIFPHAIYSALKIKDSFFTRHVPAEIDMQVVSIMKLNDSVYTLNRLMLPGEGTTKYIDKKFAMRLFLDRTSDNRMLIANSFTVYKGEEPIFDVHNEATNRNIQAFKHSESSNLIYYYVSEKLNGSKKGNLYSYHPEYGKKHLYEFEGWGSVAIIPEKNELIRLIKKDSTYYFNTYILE